MSLKRVSLSAPQRSASDCQVPFLQHPSDRSVSFMRNLYDFKKILMVQNRQSYASSRQSNLLFLKIRPWSSQPIGVFSESPFLNDLDSHSFYLKHMVFNAPLSCTTSFTHTHTHTVTLNKFLKVPGPQFTNLCYKYHLYNKRLDNCVRGPFQLFSAMRSRGLWTCKFAAAAA